MRNLKRRILAFVTALAMIAALIPAAAVPVFADGEAETSVLTYIAPDGDQYGITETMLSTYLNEDENSPLSEVFAAAGVPDEDLAECSYTFASADGYSATLRASEYENLAFYYDGSGWRDTLLDTSAYTGGWYKVSGLATITGTNHNYSGQDNCCTNQITVAKNTTEACGAEGSAIMTYIAPDGDQYEIYASVLAGHLNEDANSPLAEVFTEIGVPDEDLAECSYTFTSADGYSATLRASEYENLAFYYDGSGWRDTLLDTSAYTGGWYKVSGLATITGTNHNYSGQDNCCTNQITIAKNTTEACGAEGSAILTYIAPDGDQYEILASVLVSHLNDDANSPMSEVFAEIGVPDEDLAECSYTFASSDGYSATLRASEYENLAFYYDGSGWRDTLLDTSAYTGGWYRVSGLATITGTNHNYSEEDNCCTNQITVAKNTTEACGAEGPASQITEVSMTTTEFTWTGSEITADDVVVVKCGDTVLTLGSDYTLAYENNTDAGTAKVIATGTGKYTGTLETAFEIHKYGEDGFCESCGAFIFTDVPSKPKTLKYVSWAYLNKIVVGTGANTFSPEAECSRVQFVMMLWKMNGSPVVKGVENPFSDVTGNKTTKAVLWALDEGIINSGSKFDPDGSITRAQIVMILWKMAGKPAVEGIENPFTDVNGSKTLKAVLWAYSTGLTVGTSETTFEPDTCCTRLQLVTFLYKYNNL